MTTEAQTEANKRNAVLSTGPKTSQGKGRSSGNAVRHGFRSELAVLPFEQAEEWERHRDGVIRSLTPVGALEEALAFRVALCLWRMQRVAVYEAATTTAAIEATTHEIERHSIGDPIAVALSASAADFRKLDQAEKKLEKARILLKNAEADFAIVELLAAGADDDTLVDGGAAGNVMEDADLQLPRDEDDDEAGFDTNEAEFLVSLGLPEEESKEPWDWQGWTVGMVRRGIAVVAEHAEYPADKLLARMASAGKQHVEEKRQEVRRLETKAKAIRRRAKAAADRARLLRLLPDAITLDKLSRYEAHLSRMLFQALHELERLKAARAGAEVPPPAALDVTVNGPTQALEMALENASQP
jgi:hypothetical protein